MSSPDPYAPPVAGDVEAPRGETAVRVAGWSVVANALLSLLTVGWVYTRLRRAELPVWIALGPRLVIVALELTAAALLLAGGRRFRWIALGLATIGVVMPLAQVLLGRLGPAALLMPAAYLVSLAILLGGRPSHGRIIIGILLAAMFVAVRIAAFF